MANRACSTAIKFVSACGLALVVANLGLGAGIASADGHNIVDGDGTWGSPDGAEQRGTSIVPALHAIDTSANVIPSWPGALTHLPNATWPAPPSWGSYPTDPSWPGEGWGVADN